MSGLDVVLDMNELMAHRVVNDCDLQKVTAYTPNSVELCRVTYACDLMPMCVKFWDEILLRGGGGGGGANVKTRKIRIFEKL